MKILSVEDIKYTQPSAILDTPAKLEFKLNDQNSLTFTFSMEPNTNDLFFMAANLIQELEKIVSPKEKEQLPN